MTTKPAIGMPGWLPENVHPVAALFPMLTDAALTELADDIKSNGLRHPLLIDAEGTLIDGRNRLEACKRVGVEPTFTFLNGHDPNSVIWSENAKRRQMTQGSLAMVAAAAYLASVSKEGLLSNLDSKIEKKGSGGSNSEGKLDFAKLAGVPRQRFQEALLVHRFASDLIPEVVAGTGTLDNAFKQAKARKKETDWRDNGLAELRKVAPDIASKVQDGEITVEEGRKEHEDREKAAAVQRDSLFMGISNFTRAAQGFKQSEVLPRLPEWLKRDDAKEQFKRYFKNGPEQLLQEIRDLREAADAIETVVQSMKEEGQQ